MYKVTFLNIPSHPQEIMTSYPPVGILSMSACLKERGYDVRFIDADVNRLSPESVVSELETDRPDLVGISLNVSHVKHAGRYIKAIQTRFPGIPIIVGGPYVSGVNEAIFNDFPSISYAVINEGEEAICDFMEFLSGDRPITEVRNLAHSENGEVRVNTLTRIKNLDSLPLPDYSLVAPFIDKYYAPAPTLAAPSVAIMCTRGCPFNCTFCSSPISWHRKVTFRKTDLVIKEILYLKEYLGIKEVYFQDDTLNARKSWLMDLCDKIIEHGLNRTIYFKCALRVNKNLISEEILAKLREANFWAVLYGVENGNEEMLKSMNKNITLEEIERAFKLTRKAGLSTNAAFMIGNYGETRETVMDSINLMKRIKPDYVGFSITSPFPGSELHRIAVEKGLISIDSFTDYQFGDVILRTEELNKDDLIYYSGLAAREYYKMKQSFAYRFVNRKNVFSKMNGEGFYWPERWHTWVKRTMKNCAYVLPLNGHSPKNLRMKIQADYPDIAERAVTVKLWVDGRKHSIKLLDGEWKEFSFPLTKTAESHVNLKWKVDRTWNPSQHGHVNDDRDVGITVERIWLE